MTRCWIILSLIFFCSALNAADFTKKENKLIRQCNTARFSLQHGLQMKEFIRLMNLARKDARLLQKYIKVKYGDHYAEQPIYEELADKKASMKRPLLRPSVGLHAGAWLHAVFGGITGHVGHGNFELRSILTLNLMSYTPNNTRGENCDYGNKKAIDIFTNLMNSPGHRKNILNPQFYRVGVSKKFHLKYRNNTVTMFSGKKVRDYLFSFYY